MKDKNNLFNQKHNYGQKVILPLTCLLVLLIVNTTYANGISDAGISNSSVDIQWPWTKFLNSLATELTGPLPKVLGITGIAGASIAMFMGHNGAATQRFLLLIFAISTCLFAPTFISAITGSAGGMTIWEVLGK